jgi:Phospholipase_D-nuclease N-terminal
MLFNGGFTFANFATDLVTIFLFILWFWLLITIAGDLFRRSDISGFGKTLWVILLIILPYAGIFAYLLTQGGGMARRGEEQARRAQDDLRQMVGYSVADEITKLNKLRSDGALSEQEYSRLRARLVQ